MGISLSPGTAGGRFAIGYQGVYSPKSMREFSVIGEVRFVLLYTWGNPLLTHPNRTLAGAELRCSLGWINVGTGYYWQISHTTDSHKNFYGYHIGVGI